MVVRWYVEPDDRFHAGATIVVLRATDGQEGEIRAQKAGRLTQMDCVMGESGIAGRHTLGRFETVSWTASRARWLGVCLVVILIAVGILVATHQIGGGNARIPGSPAIHQPIAPSAERLAATYISPDRTIVAKATI